MATTAGPNLDRLSSIKEDGSRNHIHPADVKGRFVSRRNVVYAVLIAIYVAMPFVRVGGKPAIHLDIAARRFFLFGATFNAQDAWLVFFLITTVGFGLLFFTAWLGRVWCGWACPQTVFMEGVYRRVERWIEGPREKRIRLNRAPMSADKAARKILKHAAFLLISLGLAHVFISLFVSLGTLFEMVQHDPREHWAAFVWVMAVTGALYFNFAWFREQLCIVICPYGRLQSVMQDNHSLVIGYDVKRGEPRSRITRADRAAQKFSLPQVAQGAMELQSFSSGSEACPPKGDCIECNRCVVVCPTGIDIRDGLQLECIGCAQCIDACDDVMFKVGRPTGLIRYDSLAGLAGEERRVVRPRLVAYAAALGLVATGLFFGLAARTPFEANLVRVRGAPYILDAGNIRNQYELHIVNKNPGAAAFSIDVGAPDHANVTVPTRTVTLGPFESFRLPIFVSIDASTFGEPFDIEVEIVDGVSSRHREVSARFLGPNGSTRLK